MAFTSLAFMIFAPLFFLVYYQVSAARRPLVLGMASLLFYAYWDIRYVPLLLVSATIDYVCSLRLHHSPDVKVRRFWLILALTLNLSFLFFFKYWNFFAGTVHGLTGLDVVMYDLVLPLGISFYTLQTLSYTFDVYRGDFEPEPDFGTYFLYVSFFPQLVAGPIERASKLLPQVRNLRLPTDEEVRRGCMVIAWGFFAKLVVADNLSGFVSSSYFDSDGGLVLWPISFFAAAQVYCDFFGYTLIARGLAGFMGVQLSLNFRQPFFAKNLTSFWQRWHMTLTRWVMDYIHLPLARRNRTEPMRSILTLGAMCLIGLWHGASWNFVMFGLINGVIMRIWAPVGRLLSVFRTSAGFNKLFSRFALFMTICFASPFFFIRDTGQLFSQVGSMFSSRLGTDVLTQAGDKESFVIGALMLMVFLINDGFLYSGSKLNVEAMADRPIARKLVFGAIIASIILLGNFTNRGFIYFEF